MKIFQSKIFRNLLQTLLVFVVVFASSCPFFPSASAATGTDYGVGRTRSCSSSGEPSTLEFDPTTGGHDVEFVMSNPVCITVAVTTYAAFKLAIAVMNGYCGSGSVVPRVIPSPLQDAYEISKATVRATTNGTCAVALTPVALAFINVIAQLGIIYAIALPAYQNTSICGAHVLNNSSTEEGWLKPNPTLYNLSAADHKQEVESAVAGYARTVSDQDQLSLDSGNKNYREWYYGGVEYEDDPANSGEETCRDPAATPEDRAYSSYPAQKYYLKGLETGNYNCKRYNIMPGANDPATGLPFTGDRLDDFKRAYACCIDRSQNYVCINYKDAVQAGTGNGGYNKFCRAGTLCTIHGVTFSTKSLDNGRLICAETYSLCPYNFSVGGGTEYCDYYRDGIWSNGRWNMITPEEIEAGTCSSNSEIRNSDCTFNNKAGKCKNYCQYLTHCTKTSDATYQYISSLGSPYFSDACVNFVGDSQNSTSFNGGALLGSQRHFSAPIAQCVKETLENVFYNRAGHSQCLNINEYPSAAGVCASGQYQTDGSSFIYKKGNTVKQLSFFSTLQNAMQDIVRLVLTLSVTFYGMNILLGKNDIRVKKDILVYVLKLAMVLYFSTGDAWQSMFFQGVYGASMELSRMVFKIEANQNELKRDGCQFGKIVLVSDDDTSGVMLDTGKNYPPGKEYLALWDTLDCKIMRYLGFGPEVSTANIVSLIFAGFMTGAVGIYFAMAVMFFGFFFIAATIRALHIFLSSSLSIIIFVFVSPIIIPCCLFARTNDIYKKWLSNLISFCFQPMILFAYIAIFCTVMDKALIGSAIFVGTAPSKTIACSEICQDYDGDTVAYEDNVPPPCDQPGQKLINPMNDSVACLIGINSFGKFPGFELLGISLPVLTNVLTGDVKGKIITLLKGALVMYLLYKFMDEIPGITSSLIGGTALPASGAPTATEMFNKTAGFLAAVQLRANRAMKKGAIKGGTALENAANKLGNQGKSVGEAMDDASGADRTGSPQGGSDDSDGGGGGDESGSSESGDDDDDDD